MTHRPEPDDDTLDRALAQALGPKAEDTAPLSRAVLSRLAEGTRPRPPVLGEVLADPRRMGGLMLGALLLAGGLGYALLPAGLEEAVALVLVVGPGF